MGQACGLPHHVMVGMNYREISENVWQKAICDPSVWEEFHDND